MKNLNCPFCGSRCIIKHFNKEIYAGCSNENCACAHLIFPLDEWNTRIEDNSYWINESCSNCARFMGEECECTGDMKSSESPACDIFLKIDHKEEMQELKQQNSKEEKPDGI